VDILLNGVGGLTLSASFDTEAAASGVAVADLDGDGHPDLIATTTSYDLDSGIIDAEARIWLSVDGGTAYRTAAPVPLDHGGYRVVAAGDLDRDGNIDLALVSAHSSTLAVVLGKGDGTFQPPSYTSVAGNPTGLGLADFRRAGWLDVAVSVAGIFPFLGMSVFPGAAPDPMPLNPEVRVLSDASSAGIAIADFTGDGIPDVALTLYDFGAVAILPGMAEPPVLPDPLTYKPAPHVAVAQLAFNGGPVIHNPHLVTLRYQDDPEAAIYEDFDSWIVTSPWLAQIGQDYGIGLGTNDNVVIGQNAPSSLTDPEIRRLIYEVILDGGAPPPVVLDGGGVVDELYMLYLPWGTTVDDSQIGMSCQNFGGYHGEDDFSPIHFAYAVIPTCDPAAPYYQEITASHELAEASSDPLVATAPAFVNISATVNGWVGEIGDLCTQYDTGYQMPDGGPYFTVQRIWSMSAADAGAQPCIPAPRPLYANVSPDAGAGAQGSEESAFTANAGDTLTLTLTGWSNAPAVPFAVRAEPWGVGLVPASYGLGVSIDKSNLANGEEAHLTVTVPADAAHGSLGIATIFSGFDDDNFAYWPIVVFVP
jgi:hypothetical protein